jgi:hypothetical protein
MAAHIVNSVKRAIDIKDTDRFTVDIETPAGAGFDVAGFTNPYEISHALDPFPTRAPKIFR